MEIISLTLVAVKMFVKGMILYSGVTAAKWIHENCTYPLWYTRQQIHDDADDGEYPEYQRVPRS